MTESEAKLIESMADDYSNVLKEAKSMGCKEIRALYNIPLKNMELIINALEKQIEMKKYCDENDCAGCLYNNTSLKDNRCMNDFIIDKE